MTGPYDELIAELKLRYEIRVRRWRRSMSGCAWAAVYADGEAIQWVESPYPRSPLSLAIFLHEIGHHQIGFYTFRRRCEEEYHAWSWALAEMRRLGVPIDARVATRVRRSLEHALDKAVRRGIKVVPEPLLAYARAA